MTKQQGQLLVMAVGVVGVIGLVIWRVNIATERTREELARIEAEQQPPIVPKLPATTPDDLLRSMEAMLRALAKSADTLEENHLQRRAAKEKGMPFPAELDISSQVLKTRTLEQLSSLEGLIHENLERKWDERILDKLLAYKKQAAGLRDVLQRTNFDPEPSPKK